jgi:hypothetical protein
VILRSGIFDTNVRTGNAWLSPRASTTREYRLTVKHRDYEKDRSGEVRVHFVTSKFSMENSCVRMR